MCWVFVFAALLLKQISILVLLEPMFQHVFRHLCKMLDMMFQHPGTVQCVLVMPICTRALYCLRKQYFVILLTKQRAYLYRISCGIFLKLLLYFKKYLKLFWTILKMFRHFRTFHIWFLFLFCKLAEPICFVLEPNKNI